MAHSGSSLPFLTAIVKAATDGRWHRFSGRFGFARHLVARWRGWRDRMRAVEPESQQTLFERFDAENCLASLRCNGIWSGLQLPQAMVGEIATFARARPCRNGIDGLEIFRFEEVHKGRTPRGMPVAIAEVQGCEECPEVEAVAADPALLIAARRYLGFHPRKIQRRLYWSPAADLSGDQRRNCGQTIDFHYDIEPARSLYAFFYIEGGQRDSGAHVAVIGSHRNKPLRLALAPAFQSDARIFAHYPREREQVLEGGPGFGFLEDPGCYHKALPPLRSHRLVLQLRLS
jgi:hypothetical protein